MYWIPAITSVCSTVTFMYICWLAKQSYNVYKDILSVYGKLHTMLEMEKNFAEANKKLKEINDSTKPGDCKVVVQGDGVRTESIGQN